METKSWKIVDTSGSGPISIGWHSANLIKDNIYIIGGIFCPGKPNTNIYIYNIIKSAWTVLKCDMEPKYEHSALIFGDSIIVLGGMRPKTKLEQLDEDIQQNEPEGSYVTSTISENDVAEKKQYGFIKIDFNKVYLLSTSNLTKAS